MHIDPEDGRRYICVRMPEGPYWPILKQFKKECNKRGAIYNHVFGGKFCKDHFGNCIWISDGNAWRWRRNKNNAKVYFAVSNTGDRFNQLYIYDMLSQWDEIMLEVEDFVKEQAKNKSNEKDNKRTS